MSYDELPLCACVQYYDSHHPECPARYAYEALASRLDSAENAMREQWCGMTLRDYFAAKAMQSLISKHGFISDEINFAAEHSYEIADAMLRAREASND